MTEVAPVGVVLDSRAEDFESKFKRLLDAQREVAEDVDRIAGEIIADVRARGDAALIEYTARFDRLTLTPQSLRLPSADIAAASISGTS